MLNYLDRLGKPIIEVSEAAGPGRRYDRGEHFTLNEMLPAQICPFAYYNLTPYIATLLNNGWFRWVKKEERGGKRHIPASQFKDSRINSAFPNEVLVQCPNPHVSVVMGVGLEKNDKGKTITVRVLNQDAPCPMGHKIGDRFDIGESDLKIPALTYYALFPYLLLSAYKKNGFVKCPNPEEDTTFFVHQEPDGAADQPHKENFDVCFPYKEQQIRATAVGSPCRYHSSPTGIERSSPAGMCLAAFHVAYPYGLALLYDGKFASANGKETAYVRCPNHRGGIVLEVKRVLVTSTVVRYLKSVAARAFELLFHPVDIIDHKIVYTVSDVQGNCPAHHKVSQQFELNIWDKKELCPASFHSLYPYLSLKNQGFSFDWQEGKESNEVSCPDCHGAVYKF